MRKVITIEWGAEEDSDHQAAGDYVDAMVRQINDGLARRSRLTGLVITCDTYDGPEIPDETPPVPPHGSQEDEGEDADVEDMADGVFGADMVADMVRDAMKHHGKFAPREPREDD